MDSNVRVGSNPIFATKLKRMNNAKKFTEEFLKIEFPETKRVKAKLLTNNIEGIPTEDMPQIMAEMFKNFQETSGIPVKYFRKEDSPISKLMPRNTKK